MASEKITALIEEVQYMLEMTRTPKTLKEVGIQQSTYEGYKQDLVESVLNDVCTSTNPREVSKEDIEHILEDIFE